jgi:putative two-component system response regulator
MLPRIRNLLTMRAQQKWLENTSERLEVEVWRRTAALMEAEQHIVHCLARAAEYRDNDTGRHVIRVGLYAALIAKALGLGENYVRLIAQAAQLHDVGKIGIPDVVLLKTGRLDPSEMKVMQHHCVMGEQVIEDLTEEDQQAFRRHVQMGASILGPTSSPLLKMASQIALTHHERWDGTGYPFGLTGEQIPLEGRITAVADVFDALSSRRPYKPAFPLEKCYAILEEGRGKHFDPRILDAFLAHRDEAVAIQIEHADPK